MPTKPTKPAEERRAELAAEGAYVSPTKTAAKRGEVEAEPTRAGAVEPPLMDEDPSQKTLLEQAAEIFRDELLPEDEMDAAVIAAFHNNGIARPKGLHAKLAEIMELAGRIPKNGVAAPAMGGYKFVQVGDAADPIRKALAERGVTMMPHDIEETSLFLGVGKNSNMNLQTIKITWRLTDSETGEFFDLPSLGTGGDTGDKFSPKAQTNAMKYALLMGFLLSTGDDPEAADLSDTPTGAPITITGSAVGGVQQGGRQTKATQIQLDAIRNRARELELTPESMAVLIAANLGGRAPDIDALENVSDQQRTILAFLGELSFEDCATVLGAIETVLTPIEAALAPEDVGAK